jgi:hypothetical protein
MVWLRLDWWVVSCGWKVVGFGSVCEPLGVVPGDTASRIGIRSCRNEMCGRLRRCAVLMVQQVLVGRV